jgi:CheY-like chemotaxis protein
MVSGDIPKYVSQSEGMERGGSSERILQKNGQPLSVLIVEDDALIAMDHSAMIEELGGRVAAINGSGAEAIRSVETLAPDVVLMDVHLRGEMDGIEAARIIRRRFGIPVVFVTGHGDSATMGKMLAVTDQHPVLKPVGAGTLYAAILRACED